METTILPQGIKPDEEKVMKFIFENAFGNPVEFSSVPTLGIMSVNSWGYFGNDFYIKLSSTKGIKISGSAFS